MGVSRGAWGTVAVTKLTDRSQGWGLRDRELRNTSYGRLKAMPGATREEGKVGRNKGHMHL